MANTLRVVVVDTYGSRARPARGKAADRYRRLKRLHRAYPRRWKKK